MDKALEDFNVARGKPASNKEMRQAAGRIFEAVRTLAKQNPTILDLLNNPADLLSIFMETPNTGPLAMPLTSLGVIVGRYGVKEPLYAAYENDLKMFPMDRVDIPGHPNFSYSGEALYFPRAIEDLSSLKPYYPEMILPIKEVYGGDFKIPLQYVANGNSSLMIPFGFNVLEGRSINDLPGCKDLTESEHKANPIAASERMSRHISPFIIVDVIGAEHVLFRKKGTLDRYAQETTTGALEHELTHAEQYAWYVKRAQTLGFNRHNVLLLTQNEIGATISAKTLIDILRKRADLVYSKYIVIDAETPFRQLEAERYLEKTGLKRANIVVINTVSFENDALQRFQNVRAEKREVYDDAHLANFVMRGKAILAAHKDRREDSPFFQPDSEDMDIDSLETAMRERREGYDTFAELVAHLEKINEPYRKVKKQSLLKGTELQSLPFSILVEAADTMQELTKATVSFAKAVQYDEVLKQKEVSAATQERSERLDV